MWAPAELDPVTARGSGVLQSKYHEEKGSEHTAHPLVVAAQAGEILIKEGDTGLGASELYVVKTGEFEVLERRQGAPSIHGPIWDTTGKLPCAQVSTPDCLLKTLFTMHQLLPASPVDAWHGQRQERCRALLTEVSRHALRGFTVRWSGSVEKGRIAR